MLKKLNYQEYKQILQNTIKLFESSRNLIPHLIAFEHSSLEILIKIRLILWQRSQLISGVYFPLELFFRIYSIKKNIVIKLLKKHTHISQLQGCEAEVDDGPDFFALPYTCHAFMLLYARFDIKFDVRISAMEIMNKLHKFECEKRHYIVMEV